MAYSYCTLEQTLERAAYRLPVGIVGQLMTQVEDVITSGVCGQALEKKITLMIDEHAKTKAFNLTRVSEVGSQVAAAA